jgi:hypothetical protein
MPPFLALALCAMILTLWACAPAAPKPPPFNGAALEPAVSLPALH